MTDENKNPNGSADAGSPRGNQDAPSNGQASKNDGQDWKAVAEQALKENENLNKVLGAQGNELGEFRDYFQKLQPLLDELQDKPEVVDAILEGKLSAELVQAALDGKVEIKTAQQASETVEQAHEAVKKDLGKEYKNIDPSEVEKLVSQKVEAMRKEITNEVLERESDRAFEERSQKFIDSTHDWDKYAEEVINFLKEHPDQTDLSVAYHAVKGMSSSKATKEEEDKRLAEEAKRLAMNSGGGGSMSTDVIKDKSLIDSLISGPPRSSLM